MKAIFKFLDDKFSSMPNYVQVITYACMLVMFIYFSTLPRFIDMKLYSTIDGDTFPLRDAEIQVEISGRAIRILTDSNGRFSVPISNMLPHNDIMFVLKPDPNKDSIKVVEVPVTNSYMHRSTITYNKSDSSYTIDPNGIINPTMDLFAFISPFSKAYANEKKMLDYEDVESSILSNLSKITGIPKSKLNLKDDINSNYKMDQIDLSYFNSKLINDIDVDMWDELKNPNLTVGGLIESTVIKIGIDNSFEHSLNRKNDKIKSYDLISELLDNADPTQDAEQKVNSYSFNEINNHCQKPRVFKRHISPKPGWEIDIKSIKPRVKVSSKSTFKQITNIRKSGFEIKGVIINNGRCMTVFGTKMGSDSVGYIKGSVIYEEIKIN